jgi:hypothetical protein
LGVLDKVILWKRFQKLNHLRMEELFADAEVTFFLIDEKQNTIAIPSTGSEHKYADKSGSAKGYYPVFHVRNSTSKTLFFYLFYLSRQYEIVLLDWQEVGSNLGPIVLYDVQIGRGFFLPAGIYESTETFKVVISTEEVQAWRIVQQGIKVGGEASTPRDRDRDSMPVISIDEWVARTYDITLQRPVDIGESDSLRRIDSQWQLIAPLSLEMFLCSTRSPYRSGAIAKAGLAKFSAMGCVIMPLAHQDGLNLDTFVIRQKETVPKVSFVIHFRPDMRPSELAIYDEGNGRWKSRQIDDALSIEIELEGDGTSVYYCWLLQAATTDKGMI